MLTAIIVAGGGSQRMGFDKIFALLGDRPVIAHSLGAFEAAECVEAIILVARPERLRELRAIAGRFGFQKIVAFVPGGMQRQDSVSEGLKNLPLHAQYVAVHDAARPLITPAQITRVFAAAQAEGAAALAAPVTDTLKSAGADSFVSGSIERAGVYAMQTPQIFACDLLQYAYRRVTTERLSITDEVSALQHLGQKVLLVPNHEPNVKITYPPDLALAEFVLHERTTRPPS